MSDFSDAPFVAGSLFGLRAFAVDRYGRLYGPSFDQVFRPGENEAMCRKDELSTFSFGGMSMTMRMTAPVFSTASAPASLATKTDEAVRKSLGMPEGGIAKVAVSGVREVEVTVEPPKHRVGQLDCSCGFYAYFDGSNSYDAGDRVPAILEGYGICTKGDRGFRASKARLTALILPPKRIAKAHGPNADLIARNYPDVPIFPSTKAALAEFPISTPAAPTPDDADFWTRPIR